MLFEYMKFFTSLSCNLRTAQIWWTFSYRKKLAKRLHVFVFFPYDMPNVGITRSYRLAQLLQMNVKVPSTEPVRKHVFNKREFHFSYSFESWPAITSSTKPLFLVLKLPSPLPSPPLPSSPFFLSPPFPFLPSPPLLSSPPLFSSPCRFGFWDLELVLRQFWAWRQKEKDPRSENY